MEINNRSVCVLGAGHLAAAVRVQLRQAGSSAVCDDERPPALFLACSDFDNTSLRLALARRIGADRASVLFACLNGRRVRVGPVVTTHVKKLYVPSYLTRSWDFSLGDRVFRSTSARDASTPYVDIGVTQVAQIGATLVVGELAKIWGGDEGIPQGKGVAEIDSPTDESEWEWASDVSRSKCDETFVAGDVPWRAVCRSEQTWHPAGIV
jgi:hypothetical protein